MYTCSHQFFNIYIYITSSITVNVNQTCSQINNSLYRNQIVKPWIHLYIINIHLKNKHLNEKKERKRKYNEDIVRKYFKLF